MTHSPTVRHTGTCAVVATGIAFGATSVVSVRSANAAEGRACGSAPRGSDCHGIADHRSESGVFEPHRDHVDGRSWQSGAVAPGRRSISCRSSRLQVAPATVARARVVTRRSTCMDWVRIVIWCCWRPTLPLADIFGTVDINRVPESILSSVQTITGGASAVYGSDAMSGSSTSSRSIHFEGASSTRSMAIRSGRSSQMMASLTSAPPSRKA